MLKIILENNEELFNGKEDGKGFKGYPLVDIFINQSKYKTYIKVSIFKMDSPRDPNTTYYVGESNPRRDYVAEMSIFLEREEGKTKVIGQYINLKDNYENIMDMIFTLDVDLLSDVHSDNITNTRYTATGYIREPSLNDLLGFVYSEVTKYMNYAELIKNQDLYDKVLDLRDSIFTESFCNSVGIVQDLEPEVKESIEDFVLRRTQAMNNFHMLKACKFVPEEMDFETFLERIQGTPNEVEADPCKNFVKEFQTFAMKFTNYVPETTLAHVLADLNTFLENVDLNFVIKNQDDPKLTELLKDSLKGLELQDGNLKNLFKLLGQTVLKNF